MRASDEVRYGDYTSFDLQPEIRRDAQTRKAKLSGRFGESFWRGVENSVAARAARADGPPRLSLGETIERIKAQKPIGSI